MKNINFIFRCLLITVFVLSASTLAQQDFIYHNGEKVYLTVSSEKICVKLKTNIPEATIEKLLQKESTLKETVPHPVSTHGFNIITLRENIDVKGLIQKLKHLPDIEFVQPIYFIDGIEAVPYDQFIVQFKLSVLKSDIEALNLKYNVEVVRISTASDNLFTLKITPATKLSILEISNLYYESLPCEWSLPDFYIPIEKHDIPNDTYFSNQYYLHNTGQTGGVYDADINAVEAWDISKGNSSIVVAVLDEGVSTMPHEDLTNIWSNSDETIGDGNGDGFPGVKNVDDDGDGKIDEDTQGRQPGEPGYTNDLKDDDDENGYVDDYEGWDFSDYDNNPSPDGNQAHGMAVAGIIGAKHNSKGIAGLAPNCIIMPIKLYDKDGKSASVSRIAYAIDYAWKNGAHVIRTFVLKNLLQVAEKNIIVRQTQQNKNMRTNNGTKQ